MRHRRSGGPRLNHDAIGQALPAAIVAVFFPISLIVGLNNKALLPEKFFYDSATLRSRMPMGDPSSGDSFIVMGWIYRQLGGMNHYAEVQIAQMAIFAVLLLTCVPWRRLSTFGPLATAGVLYALVSSAVYLAQYSKESLVVVLVLLLRVLPKHWSMDLAFVGALAVYAQHIRTYWYIIAGLYLVLRVLLPRLRSMGWLPILALVGYVVMAFGLQAVMGQPLSYARDVVSESRTFSQDAQSAIQNYLPTANPVLGGLNAWLTLATLIVPLPLLLSPNPLYLVFCAVTIGLWVGLVLSLRRLLAAGRLRVDVGLTRAVSMIFALIFAQALFEPDFGSYLRHSLPTMPLFFLVYARAQQLPSRRAPLAARSRTEPNHVV